jgi:hypothetical protein
MSPEPDMKQLDQDQWWNNSRLKIRSLGVCVCMVLFVVYSYCDCSGSAESGVLVRSFLAYKI